MGNTVRPRRWTTAFVVVVIALIVGLSSACLFVSAMAFSQEVDVNRDGLSRESLPELSVVRFSLWRWDYNTRVVALGTVALGVGSAVVGTFLLLRKQALWSDVVSHAALPGVGLAFLLVELLQPGAGKWFPGLLVGAASAGIAAMAATTWLRSATRLKDDAALAIVLSVSFGLGIVLFTIVQRLPSGNAAGLAHFIYGKAAAMRTADMQLIAIIALVATSVCVLFFKEFRVLAFDEQFAVATGLPVTWLDVLLKSLAVIMAVVGLQSVGLLLVVALVIVPPAAARFWSDKLATMTVIAAVFGGCSGLVGVLMSAAYPRLATGATIALCGSALFVLSLLGGARRGLVWRWLLHVSLQRQAAEEHLLRACYEVIAGERGSVQVDELCRAEIRPAQLSLQRDWSSSQLRRLLVRAVRRGWLQATPGGYQLTLCGAQAAQRIVHRHRLWELYLIHYADTAPAHVDRLADDVEHVLDEDLQRMLEAHVAAQDRGVPESPHRLPLPSDKRSS